MAPPDRRGHVGSGVNVAPRCSAGNPDAPDRCDLRACRRSYAQLPASGDPGCIRPGRLRRRGRCRASGRSASRQDQGRLLPPGWRQGGRRCRSAAVRSGRPNRLQGAALAYTNAPTAGSGRPTGSVAAASPYIRSVSMPRKVRVDPRVLLRLGCAQGEGGGACRPPPGSRLSARRPALEFRGGHRGPGQFFDRLRAGNAAHAPKHRPPPRSGQGKK
jgi:hypothetical protein